MEKGWNGFREVKLNCILQLKRAAAMMTLLHDLAIMTSLIFFKLV